MKQVVPFLKYGILIFHLFVTITAFFTLFSDYDGWTSQCYYPFALLLYSILWLGVCLEKKIFFYLYLACFMVEVLVKLYFSKTMYGKVFGDVLFPVNLIFIAVVVLLYNFFFSKKMEE